MERRFDTHYVSLLRRLALCADSIWNSNYEPSPHIINFKSHNFGLILICIAFYGAEKRTLRKVDQKYLVSSEMCWRRMENISWNDRVRNGEVLQRIKEERKILHRVTRRKANCVGHILCRNCLIKHVI